MVGKTASLILAACPPLLLPSEVRTVLGCTAAELLGKLKAAELRAIDIALRWPRQSGRELRFYYAALHSHLKGRRLAREASPEAVLPKNGYFIEEDDLTNFLRCGPAHCSALRDRGAIAAPQFARYMPVHARKGPVYTRESVLAFLLKREVRL